MLRRDNRFFVRVRSDDGTEGIIAANSKLPDIISLLERLVAPYFLEKDVRDLDALVDGVYTHNRNYKYAGMPFWNSVAHVELAILESAQPGRPKWTVGQLFRQGFCVLKYRSTFRGSIVTPPRNRRSATFLPRCRKLARKRPS